jgi:hypothetical protein
MTADRKKQCFVVGPIGEDGSPERTHADSLYQEIILRVFEKHCAEWEVERADKIGAPGGNPLPTCSRPMSNVEVPGIIVGSPIYAVDVHVSLKNRPRATCNSSTQFIA